VPIRQRSRQRGRAGPGVHEGPAGPGSPGGSRGLAGRTGRGNPAVQRVTQPGGQRRRARRWLARPSARLASTATLAALAALVATPADGGTTSLATRLANAAGLVPAASHTGKPFGGLPAVGALFTSNAGKLGSHFCTASVVNSPDGNLLITAAHCVTSVQGTIAFVPGYVNGTAPYGVWDVTRVFTDQAWASSSDPDDDVAFLEVSQNSAGVPVEDVTGAEDLATGQPPSELVQVIGYPAGADQPVVCQNWTRPFGASQMEFDCGGYTNGTSGGPFLARMNQATGQGTVIGVIGGYLQGGDTPSQSFSATFGHNVSTLYQAAIAGS
jgi:V8-like Glu-specific endopeptidase